MGDLLVSPLTLLPVAALWQYPFLWTGPGVNPAVSESLLVLCPPPGPGLNWKVMEANTPFTDGVNVHDLMFTHVVFK